MKRPLVVASCRIEESDRETGPEYRLPESYIESVFASGGTALIVPAFGERHASEIAQGIVEVADGILLTGTGDIDPSFYDEIDRTGALRPDRDRDALEIELVKRAREKRLPVLGICRGIQSMNVALGGTLFQDIRKEIEGAVEHMGRLTEKSTFHTVRVTQASRLHGIIDEVRLNVNTSHHQAIKNVAAGLVVSAVSMEDGIIEGIEAEGDWFALGVQWHPERMRDTSCKRLFDAFVTAASGDG
jgi:putative glutamine amidotransferase